MSHRCDKKREKMARSDDLLNKPDSKDIKTYEGLVTKAIIAKRKIESGFLELAESIFEINKTKLYRLQYKTFAGFCEEKLGFSRQTIYVYLSILKLITEYNRFINREKAIEFGHKKMRHITEGVNAIDKSVVELKKREEMKVKIFKHVNPSMPSTEIESVIEDIVDAL